MPSCRLGIFILTAFSYAASSNAALKVIGSGYPRTGTDTLRTALNELGYNTYHMKEIIDGQLSADLSVWHVQVKNNCSDINAPRVLFEKGGWTAALDVPAIICYESLMKAFPNAKVIHTQRKLSEEWWDSASTTVLIAGSLFPFNFFGRVVPFFRAHRAMANAVWTSMVDKFHACVQG